MVISKHIATQLFSTFVLLVQVDKLLPTYLHLYDIVITGDGDFSPINELCRYLLSTSENSTSPEHN